MTTEKDPLEENHTHIDTNDVANKASCMMVVASMVFWWIIISHCIMRFQNPWMTETQLFLNLPKAFLLEDPSWGLQRAID